MPEATAPFPRRGAAAGPAATVCRSSSDPGSGAERIRPRGTSFERPPSRRRASADVPLASESPDETVPDLDRHTTRAPATDDRFSVPLRGEAVGPATRCAHYDGPRDVIAIRFACCEVYYPCFRCHRATAAHAPTRWPAARRHEPAVLCGACGDTMSADAYLESGHTCPGCGAAFNPGCAAHHDRYFAFE